MLAEVGAEAGREITDTVTRAEFTAAVMKLSGKTDPDCVASFYDVYEYEWFYKYIANAEQCGTASGYDSAFRPNDIITREEAVTMLCRSFGVKPPENILSLVCLDYASVSDYAKGYMRFSIFSGLYRLDKNTLAHPKAKLSAGLAQELITAFYTAPKSDFTRIAFGSGYPRVAENAEMSTISFWVKTNKPSKIYYTAVNADYLGSTLVPSSEAISTYLTDASETEVKVSINAEPETKYNIYFKAVDEKGFVSKLTWITNVLSMPYSEGNGSEESPYLIYNRSQLEQIGFYSSKHFKLAADIELDGEWIPIGSEERYTELFSGSLDGDGHKISGLYINSEQENAGLFSEIYGAEIKNLSVEGDVCAKSNVGIIAGTNNGGTITACSTEGWVKAAGNGAGGICGKNNGVIENSSSSAYTVEAFAYAGGIASVNAGIIKNCLSAVHTVSADMYAGGIAGTNPGGKITGCVAANMCVADIMTSNSGRISTNKQYGITKNNCSYSGMISGSNVYYGSDTKDGTPVSWRELTDISLYKSTLGWDFTDTWTSKGITGCNYMLPCLKALPYPRLERGTTCYAPIKISSAEGFSLIREKPEYHYILTNDIYLSPDRGDNWQVISETPKDSDSGFSGSLDGNGHAIHNMRLHGEGLNSAMFGTISGGIVRNLRLEDIDIYSSEYAAGICIVNHGLIENCTVSGKINAAARNGSLTVGAIVAQNHGSITGCTVSAEISADGNAVTVGGAVGSNEGAIDDVLTSGAVSVTTYSDTPSSIAGGICGSNYLGEISNSFSSADVSVEGYIAYVGGAVGMSEGGLLYKTAASGSVKSDTHLLGQSTAYIGGLAGICLNNTVMNCFSYSPISTRSEIAYSGGIIGYCEGTTLQSTYAAGTINQVSDLSDSGHSSYAGGIVGYSAGGTLSGNAAVNRYILSAGKTGMTAGFAEDSYASEDNFFSDGVYVNSTSSPTGFDGIKLSAAKFKSTDFFLKPLSDGGLLGWSSVKYDGSSGIWTSSPTCDFPILNGVRGQYGLKQGR